MECASASHQTTRTDFNEALLGCVQEGAESRRVRIFIAEKSLQVEVVSMDLHKDNRTPEFRKKNPMGTLPVLELDDGTCIAESMAICRYLEALHREPCNLGASPLDVATIEM